MIALTRTRTSPIGLHLGQRSATLVQLAGNRHAWEVHALAHGEFTHDEDASPKDQDRETADALRRLIADHPFKGRQVVSCLGASELFVQNVRLPQLPPEEVAKVVHWEAEERLPYPPAEAEIRYIAAGQVRQEAAVKQEVILLGCRREMIHRHINVLEQAGLAPTAIDVEPCAVLRCLQPRGGDSSGGSRRAYLTLGERATTVLFAEGDQILFLKSIPMGGRQLDLAVSKGLDLTPAEAATVRLGVTASSSLDADDEIHRTVVDSLRNSLEAIGSEVELCLRYYKVTFRGKPLEKIVVTGSEASPWLSAFLAERIGIDCAMGDPFESLVRPPCSRIVRERPWRWTTAVGLSLKPRGNQ